MANQGYVLEPGAVINLIRDNLDDRYKRGFPIIKELLQNSDDAEQATVLHLAYSCGLPSADHPLLRGPALVVVNDGKFTHSDFKSMISFGLSNKAADSTKIGKFGLGLKSIFHLCEAFFYLASAAPAGEEQQGIHRCKILNPWSPPEGSLEAPLHEDWDHFDQSDQNLIIEHITRLIGPERWFCLWVPFRRETHCGESHPIYKYYPGDADAPSSEVITSQLPRQLAEVFPLLRRLTEVRVWQLGNEGTEPNEIYSIRISTEHQSQRCGFGPGNRPRGGSRTQLRGTVVVAGLSVAPGLLAPFAGVESLLDDEGLRRLKSSERWPTSGGYDPKSGAPMDQKEKNEPHAAATFMAYPATGDGKGTLRVYQTVFLPVAESFLCGLQSSLDSHAPQWMCAETRFRGRGPSRRWVRRR